MTTRLAHDGKYVGRMSSRGGGIDAKSFIRAWGNNIKVFHAQSISISNLRGK